MAIPKTVVHLLVYCVGKELVVLREIAKRLKDAYMYDEQELNEVLKGFYEDYALIRRYLVNILAINKRMRR